MPLSALRRGILIKDLLFPKFHSFDTITDVENQGSALALSSSFDPFPVAPPPAGRYSSSFLWQRAQVWNSTLKAIRPLWHLPQSSPARIFSMVISVEPSSISKIAGWQT